ncbi:lactoylglutathione lyase [Streptomyces sp. 846.5]|nr:VOC family protein [Streptomyces sp. 846.5]TDU01961.1 lactoylglutathione lyase [Streptomyces sp. 846.5]
MKPLAVHHVSVTVTDLDAAVAFYTEVLGLTVRPDRPTSIGPGAWLDAGGQQVHLIAGTPPPAHGQHFALLVDDLEAAVAQVREAGFAVSEPVAIGAAFQAFLVDPSGNAIELHGLRRNRSS